MDLNLEVTVDPNLPPVVEGAVSFNLGHAEPGRWVYGFEATRGPLLAFYEDLIAGHPMPLRFVTRRVDGPHTVVAAALFLYRDLALNPATLGFVCLADMTSRLGPWVFAHVEPSLASCLRGMGEMFHGELTKQEQGQRLSEAMLWVRSYLTEGSLPNLGSRTLPPRVLDVGSNGFVVAIAKDTPSVESWEHLFRWGHLKGILIGEPEGEFRKVVVARKSAGVGFDLERLLPILDELEALSGGQPGWSLVGDYLSAPPDGTVVLVQHLMQVILKG